MNIKSLLYSSAFALTLSSCGHIYTKSEGYAESSSATVNGAKVNAAFRPNGGNSGFSFSAMIYTAGAAKLKGPFLWRLQAEGKEGEHQTMTVHRVKVITSKTKREEWFPVKYLNKDIAFADYKKTPGVNYAYFQMPGELKVLPEEDGNVSLLVDVTVKSKTSSKREVVNFSLVPSSESDVEFIFLPTEIANSFTPDPREWDF